jgi:heterodisulfide reductase subunit A-like polyferredoxin
MPASTSKMSPFRVAACVLAVLSLAQSGAALIDDALFANRIIYKDVVIIGGGASGSHAAVRIREDFGKRVLIIEKKDRLVRIVFGNTI